METTVSKIASWNWRAALVRTAAGCVLTLGIAALGFYLFMNHSGHVVTALPYLLLMACPLMHLFMHRGHGQSHHHDRDSG